MEPKIPAQSPGNIEIQQEPQPQQPVQQPNPLAAAPPQVPAQTERRISFKLKIFIVSAALFMIFCSVIATVIVTRRSISTWDVLAAGNSAQQIGGDMSDVSAQVKAFESSATLTQFNQASTNLADSISDALSQYSLLQSSPVLKNKQADASFTALQKKWQTYKVYVQGLSNDYASIGPILVQLANNQQTALAASKNTSANLSSELTAYQGLLNAVGRQTASLTMRTDPDKELLKNLETYINNSNTEINHMNTDLSKGKNVTMITSDVTAIAASASAFSDQQDAWATKTYTTLQRLDPTGELNAFNGALSAISNRARQP